MWPRPGTPRDFAYAQAATGGLFYAFAVSVMPGLGRTDDRTFVDAMQRINVAILNPWFFISFFGAPALTVIAAALHLRADGRAVLPWIVPALALSGVALVITIQVNVPLNNALAAGCPGTRWRRWSLTSTACSSSPRTAVR